MMNVIRNTFTSTLVCVRVPTVWCKIFDGVNF